MSSAVNRVEWAKPFFDSHPEVEIVENQLGRAFQKMYAACKRQEKEKIEKLVSNAEYQAYLRSV